MEICQELFLDDVVRIDVYRASDVSCLLPALVNLQSIATTSVQLLADPILSLALDDSFEDATALLKASPTVKSGPSRAAQGMVYSHEVTATAEIGIADLTAAIDRLYAQDYYIIYTRASGDKHFGFALPQTCTHNLDVSDGSGHTASLKLKYSSMSAPIPMVS